MESYHSLAKKNSGLSYFVLCSLARLKRGRDKSNTVFRILAPPPLTALSEESVNVANRKCNTIYKGFAECLISLGDSMAQNVQQQQDDSSQELQELDTICR